jgi:hypothetical protein
MDPFHFETRGSAGGIHGLDLGHVTLSGPTGTATSKGRTPDQAMMLFPSITDLLDGVARLASAKKSAPFRFVGTDCSFSIVFGREKGDRMSLAAGGEKLGTVPVNELVEALWAGVTDLLRRDGSRFDRTADASSEAAFGDFDAAVARFARLFGFRVPN